MGPRTDSRGSNARMLLKSPRNRGSRFPGETSQSFVPRLVRISRHARGEAAIFGRKRVRQDFHRLDALRRQVEVEVARRGVDEAGAADLQRALRRLTAPDAQAPVTVPHDTRKQWQEALKIVALERSAFEDRSRQHVAHRHRLNAVGRRRGHVRPHLHFRRHERQLRVEEHLRRFVGSDGEHRGIARDEPGARGRDDVVGRAGHPGT